MADNTALPPDADHLEPLEEWDDSIDESRLLAGLRLMEERAMATTRARFPQIVHVKPAVVPLKPRVIDVMRCDEKWPPNLVLVDVLLVNLLAGLEDAAQWSEDVSRAVTVWRAARAADSRLLREHWDAKEQLDAGSRVRKERHIHRFVRRRRGERNDDAADYARDTLELEARAMRYVARRQQMLAIAEREEQESLAMFHGGLRRTSERVQHASTPPADGLFEA